MRFTEKNTQHNNELQTKMTGPQSRVFSRLKWACLQRNRWFYYAALSLLRAVSSFIRSSTFLSKTIFDPVPFFSTPLLKSRGCCDFSMMSGRGRRGLTQHNGTRNITSPIPTAMKEQGKRSARKGGASAYSFLGRWESIQFKGDLIASL